MEKVDPSQESYTQVPQEPKQEGGKISDFAEEKIHSSSCSSSIGKAFKYAIASAGWGVSKLVESVAFAIFGTKENTASEEIKPEIKEIQKMKKTEELMEVLKQHDIQILTNPQGEDESRQVIERLSKAVLGGRKTINPERERKQGSVYLSPKNLRPLMITPDGDVVMILNKKGLRDKVLGYGAMSAATLAVSLVSGKVFVSVAGAQLNPKEEQGLKAFASENGFVKAHHTVSYAGSIVQKDEFSGGKKSIPCTKTRILYDRYDQGELKTVLPKLTQAERQKVFEDLSQRMNVMHQKGYIHRDIKPANILVRGRGDSLEVVFGDMGSACLAKDKKEVARKYGSPNYESPGYRNNAGFFSGGKVAKKPADDIWALGITFHQLLGNAWEFSSDDDMDKGLETFLQREEPANKNSPEHLVWEMTRPHSKDRITAEQLEVRLATIDW